MTQKIFYAVETPNGANGMVTANLANAQECSRRFDGHIKIVESDEARRIEEEIVSRMKWPPADYRKYFSRN